jgi:hypothetical protein
MSTCSLNLRFLDAVETKEVIDLDDTIEDSELRRRQARFGTVIRFGGEGGMRDLTAYPVTAACPVSSSWSLLCGKQDRARRPAGALPSDCLRIESMRLAGSVGDAGGETKWW